ncbi:MAG: TonB-dependent receptor [Deltaproteobacteria bacterium]|nr:MAG: TonB-dependent receptor [Deltaproteobacteria bacterium]
MMKRIAGVLAVLALVAVTGCESKGGTGEAPAAAPAAAKKEAPKKEEAKTEAPKKEEAKPAAAAEGNRKITGVVTFEGEPPPRTELKMNADPVCAKKSKGAKSESVLVKDGKLQNVVVYISSELPAKPGTGEVEIHQNGCLYRPRVQCASAGQTIKIVNGDETMHNVHAYLGEGKAKTLFNQAQVPHGPAITKSTKKAGELWHFTCDVHPWMEGFIFVANNGYCAVTGEDGKFTIEGLAPGEYELTFWHEKYGTKTQKVTVPADKDAEVTVAYAAK